MYESITNRSGVGAVHEYLSQFAVTPGADGLVFALPDKNQYFADVSIPERLGSWLFDLRLLRNMPIAYLVPDAALLPTESIRFFHVDPTWVDRVIDGVFAAANTGTVDSVFSYTMLAMVREALDKDLSALAEEKIPGINWAPKNGMTGMLIRSELVRRWPEMIVRAYQKVSDDEKNPPTIPVLRAEPISKDLYIALFAGVPAMVHLREPNVGVRFGVETKPGGGYKVDVRDKDGVNKKDDPATPPDESSIDVPLRSVPRRTINVAQFAGTLNPPGQPRMVALHLEQRPYVQEFKNTRAESTGSVPLSDFQNADGTFKVIALRKGRFMRLENLYARALEIAEIQKKPKGT